MSLFSGVVVFAELLDTSFEIMSLQEEINKNGSTKIKTTDLALKKIFIVAKLVNSNISFTTNNKSILRASNSITGVLEASHNIFGCATDIQNNGLNAYTFVHAGKILSAICEYFFTDRYLHEKIIFDPKTASPEQVKAHEKRLENLQSFENISKLANETLNIAPRLMNPEKLEKDLVNLAVKSLGLTLTAGKGVKATSNYISQYSRSCLVFITRSLNRNPDTLNYFQQQGIDCNSPSLNFNNQEVGMFLTAMINSNHIITELKREFQERVPEEFQNLPSTGFEICAISGRMIRFLAIFQNDVREDDVPILYERAELERLFKENPNEIIPGQTRQRTIEELADPETDPTIFSYQIQIQTYFEGFLRDAEAYSNHLMG